jgi:AraC-like DNA-binding protein
MVSHFVAVRIHGNCLIAYCNSGNRGLRALRSNPRYSGDVDDLNFISVPTLAGVVTNPPGTTFGPRRMTEYEFVWMIEGDAIYAIDGAIHVASSGSMVLCRPGTVDAFAWDPVLPSRQAYLHFNVVSLPAHWPSPSLWPVVRVLPDDDILRPMYRHILATRDQADERHLQCSIAHMLSAFVTGTLSLHTDYNPSRSAPVERALSYLYSRLSESPSAPISLPELARAAAVTPEHLCRLFSAEIGHTPAETVRLARLDRAATLIWRTNHTLSEIADLCGFTDGFHLSRRFKAVFGRSPSEIREAVKAGETPPLSRLLRT